QVFPWRPEPLLTQGKERHPRGRSYSPSQSIPKPQGSTLGQEHEGALDRIRQSSPSASGSARLWRIPSTEASGKTAVISWPGGAGRPGCPAVPLLPCWSAACPSDQHPTLAAAGLPSGYGAAAQAADGQAPGALHSGLAQPAGQVPPHARSTFQPV